MGVEEAKLAPRSTNGEREVRLERGQLLRSSIDPPSTLVMNSVEAATVLVLFCEHKLKGSHAWVRQHYHHQGGRAISKSF